MAVLQNDRVENKRIESTLAQLPAPLLFGTFCFLVASRDVLSHRLLTQNVDVVFLLTAYTVSASVFAWCFRLLRTGSPAFISPFRLLPKKQKVVFLKLGIATWLVYVVTMFGISKLTAPLFNAVDYGAMPLMTLGLAIVATHESVVRRQILGACISAGGLLVFVVATQQKGFPAGSGLWVGISLLSPILTSVCSMYQRQQVQSGMHPDEVLLYRFPIPAVLMLVWLLATSPRLALNQLPQILLISMVCLFLPLWLLCLGFVRASLGRFSAYLFLIPIFTFILGPLLVKGQLALITRPSILVGAGLALCGFCVFEGLFSRKR
jgi:drug/metabolite transporter (DMT)-like permease